MEAAATLAEQVVQNPSLGKQHLVAQWGLKRDPSRLIYN
jgi:hypothetical protein